MKTPAIFGAVFVAALLIYLAWDNHVLRNRLSRPSRDSTTRVETSWVKPKPINLDSIPAVLALRSRLNQSRARVRDLEAGRRVVDSMYAAALDSMRNDSTRITVPVAVLDTAIVRDAGGGVMTADTVHSEYYFPPVNAFFRTEIKLGKMPEVTTTKTVTIEYAVPPTLWEKLGYVGIGAGIGVAVVGALVLIRSQ